MKGNKIIVSSNPKGQFIEGIISGTPKPGQIMEMTTTALVGGRATYQAGTRSAGAKGPNYVLLEDDLQGKTATDAYVTGTRGRLYLPAAGEEVNAMFGDVSGTGCAEDIVMGDLLGVSGSKLVHNSAYTSVPFQAMEAVGGFITTDFLLHCTYLGDQA